MKNIRHGVTAPFLTQVRQGKCKPIETNIQLYREKRPQLTNLFTGSFDNEPATNFIDKFPAHTSC
jgi:hypothetical protein